MNIQWNKYFNHIFVISRCKNFEKREKLELQIQELDLGIKFNYWYNCDSNYIVPIKNNESINSESRCTYGHYSLWKTCYELNYDNVLILEDDIRFLKDEQSINKVLENFEKTNSDIYSFDWLLYAKNPEHYGYLLMSCYYVNRRALKFLIDMHEQYNLNNDTYIMGLKVNSQNDYYRLNTLYITNSCVIGPIDYDNIPKFNVTQQHLTIQQDYLDLYKTFVPNFNEKLYQLY